MVNQKYRGSCIGAALAKWLAKNTVASQKNGFGGENGGWCIGDALTHMVSIFGKLHNKN